MRNYADRLLTPSGLGIALEASERAGLRPGAWYSASGNPGVYVSLIAPELIDKSDPGKPQNNGQHSGRRRGLGAVLSGRV